MNYKTKPILFLIFNRPTETQKSFEIIANQKPTELYIAADGPRGLADSEDCQAARYITESIDWECSVHRLYREKNLGCKYAIVSAIDWFFSHVESGIIIEDDVLLEEGFFEFCSIMLDAYEAEEQVSAVLSFNQFGQGVVSSEYFFSRGFYPWGWGTWKNRWSEYSCDKFNIDLVSSNPTRDHYSFAARQSLKLNLSLIQKNLLDTWDYQFLYLMARRSTVAIIPRANLSTNIGYNGAHSTNNRLAFEYGSIDCDSIQHPREIRVDYALQQKLWGEYSDALLVTLAKRILLKIRAYSFVRAIAKSLFVHPLLITSN